PRRPRRSSRQEPGDLQVECAAEPAIQPEVETSLERGDCDRRPARESSGGRLRLAEELLFGHEPVYQPALEGLGRRQRNAFEDMLERARGAEHAQQPLTAATSRYCANEHLDLAHA